MENRKRQRLDWKITVTGKKNSQGKHWGKPMRK